MSNLLSHAENELSLLGGNDEMQQEMNKHILKMVQIFGEEGHSGFSASYAIGILEKLLRFEPLTPLTGEEAEWFDHGDGFCQNKRCSHVFRDNKTGRTYDINGRIFREPNGSCWTNSNSAVDVTFPYTPRSEYIDVEEVT